MKIVLESDKANPVTGPAEIHYVPEQVPGKFQVPEEVSVTRGSYLHTRTCALTYSSSFLIDIYRFINRIT